MSFVPSTFAIFNSLLFVCITIALLLTGSGDNFWAVSLTLVGLLINILAWRKFLSLSSKLTETEKSEGDTERERLMRDLGEEAQLRRERDRLERN